MKAGRAVKEDGEDNHLLEMIAEDGLFPQDLETLKTSMDPAGFTGRAAYQTEQYLREIVNPLLEANRKDLGWISEMAGQAPYSRPQTSS